FAPLTKQWVRLQHKPIPNHTHRKVDHQKCEGNPPADQPGQSRQRDVTRLLGGADHRRQGQRSAVRAFGGSKKDGPSQRKSRHRHPDASSTRITGRVFAGRHSPRATPRPTRGWCPLRLAQLARPTPKTATAVLKFEFTSTPTATGDTIAATRTTRRAPHSHSPGPRNATQITGARSRGHGSARTPSG